MSGGNNDVKSLPPAKLRLILQSRRASDAVKDAARDILSAGLATETTALLTALRQRSPELQKSIGKLETLNTYLDEHPLGELGEQVTKVLSEAKAALGIDPTGGGSGPANSDANPGNQPAAPVDRTRQGGEAPPQTLPAGDSALTGQAPRDATSSEVATPAIEAPRSATANRLSNTGTPSVTPRHRASSEDTLEIVPGELTSLGEGSDAQTKFIHWPDTGSSGVTLGKGYDIGSRSETQVIEELTAAGMAEHKAKNIARGSGLKGERANAFVTRNKNDIGEISVDVQRRLLTSMLDIYCAQARSIATSTTPNERNSNARGREIKDGKPQGTYCMTTTQWDTMHPAMIEFLTDLKYQGAYYLFDRVARINQILLANDGNQLGQFKGVATLFEAQREGVNSCMDAYALRLKERGGNKQTFYGQSVAALAKASTRRNRLRLAFLKYVIAALEAGKVVEMAKHR